ncbi:MAG: hypothetical protein HZA90_24535 [Verrucomicrobia bacterium]|nr:hypothetical protein [Verrucomicrobiota bacterium]
MKTCKMSMAGIWVVSTVFCTALGVAEATGNCSTNAAPASRRLHGLTNLVARTAPQALRPGLYSAAPYSMLVLVPRPVDNGILHPAPSPDRFPGRVIEPPLRLEPKK